MGTSHFLVRSCYVIGHRGREAAGPGSGPGGAPFPQSRTCHAWSSLETVSGCSPGCQPTGLNGVPHRKASEVLLKFLIRLPPGKATRGGRTASRHGRWRQGFRNARAAWATGWVPRTAWAIWWVPKPAWATETEITKPFLHRTFYFPPSRLLRPARPEGGAAGPCRACPRLTPRRRLHSQRALIVPGSRRTTPRREEREGRPEPGSRLASAGTRGHTEANARPQGLRLPQARVRPRG